MLKIKRLIMVLLAFILELSADVKVLENNINRFVINISERSIQSKKFSISQYGDKYYPFYPIKLIVPSEKFKISYKINKISNLNNYRPADAIKLLANGEVVNDTNQIVYPEVPYDVVDIVKYKGYDIAVIYFLPILKQGNFYKFIEDITFDIEYNSVANLDKNSFTYDVDLKNYVLNYDVFKTLKKTKIEKAVGLSNFSSDKIAFFKLSIIDGGIYKISHSKITEVFSNIKNYRFDQFKIYYGGGTQLKFDISKDDSYKDTLKEMATFTDDDGDGVWEDNESLFFYAEGLTRYDYFNDTCIANIYNDKNIYWLILDKNENRKNISNIETASNLTGNKVNTGFEYLYFEKNDSIGLYQNGSQWFWAKLDEINGNSVIANLFLNNPDNNAEGELTLNFYGNGKQTNLIVQINGSTVLDSTLYLFRRFEKIQYKINQGILGDGVNSIKVLLNPVYSKTVFFDNFLFKYKLKLKAGSSDQLFTNEYSENDIVEIPFEGNGSDYIIFDITDKYNIKRVIPYISGSNFYIKPNQSKRIYYILNRKNIKNINSIERVYWHDLYSSSNMAKYIIVSPEEFSNEAEKLANFYQVRDGINVKVVNIEDIYNSFSYGLIDIMAIRNFLYYSYKYWNNGDNDLEYVLLFGDGHWDLRRKYSNSFPSKIPAFETDRAGTDGYRMSDDYYVYFPDNGVMNTKYPRLAIGRLPVLTKDEAEAIVNKIIDFQKRGQDDFWRQNVILSADDEINVQRPGAIEDFHTKNTEQLICPYISDYLIEKKIYLLNYSSALKGNARLDLINELGKGAIIFNYVGHGSWERLATETLFQGSEDVGNLKNFGKYFLFYASACDVGRFDMLYGYCLAERLILNPEAGAIAAISAVRATNAGPNEALNGLFYKYALGQNRPIGKALQLAKLEYIIANDNSRYYNLLGDPYIKLFDPDFVVNVNKLSSDTLFAGKGFAFSAGLIPLKNSHQHYTNNDIYVQLIGAEKNINYKVKDKDFYINYKMPGNILFKGKVSVVSDILRGAAIIPLDINYDKKGAKIIFYNPGDENEALGAHTGLYLKGDSDVINDTISPQINAFFDNLPYKEGIKLSKSINLRIELYDENGINITGQPGHQIFMMIDNRADMRIDLGSYFHYNNDSYQKGEIEYQLKDLEYGKHSIYFRCYDNFNNQAEENFTIFVQKEKPLALNNIFNYPNPFRKDTKFIFFTNVEGNFTINILTLSGRRINRIEGVCTPGNNIVYWDGKDWDGVPVYNGTYLYTIVVKDLVSNNKIKKIGKMVKIK